MKKTHKIVMLPTEETGYFVPEGVNYNLVTHKLSKLYTREEVERLCKSAWLHGMRTEGEKFSDWKGKNL